MTSTLGSAHVGEPVNLSGEQLRLIDEIVGMAKSGRGGMAFVTGAAGVGKSVITRELRHRLNVVVLAPTGLAAINVVGQTIHSFFKLPIGPLTRGKVDPPREIETIVEAADAILIDEISMVRADLLDGVDAALQKALSTKEPFGGKLVVAIGDMWQLEPVVKREESEWVDGRYVSPFWFDAHVLRGRKRKDALDFEDDVRLGDLQIRELAHIFRQSDPEFLAALNRVRVGDPGGLFFLNERHVAAQPGGDEVALTFTNDRAHTINAVRLAALDGHEATYSAQQYGSMGRELPVSPVLTLRIGAQVMVCRNFLDRDGGLVANGSVGEVVALGAGPPLVRLRDGRTIEAKAQRWEKIRYGFNVEADEITEVVEGSLTQVPLKLAWAVTVHRAQGQTLDAASLELERAAFCHGQLYTALSRVRSLDGLFLRRRLMGSDLIVHPRIREFCGVVAPARNMAALG